jgi:hypothetical protein
MRWRADVWQAATTLAAEGEPVRAVNAWALFGCFHWNSLLLRRDGSYEPGAFDVRSQVPRLTALGMPPRVVPLHVDRVAVRHGEANAVGVGAPEAELDEPVVACGAKLHLVYRSGRAFNLRVLHALYFARGMTATLNRVVGAQKAAWSNPHRLRLFHVPDQFAIRVRQSAAAGRDSHQKLAGLVIISQKIAMTAPNAGKPKANHSQNRR